MRGWSTEIERERARGKEMLQNIYCMANDQFNRFLQVGHYPLSLSHILILYCIIVYIYGHGLLCVCCMFIV